MNIIQWFKNTAGKIPVSVMQAAGAGAVVAVAGFGAYNYLSSPAEDNNSFVPPASYNEEVVYVAGANGGSYGANGELQSAFQAAPSRAIELTQRQEAREKRNRELSESNGYYSGMEDNSSPKGAAGGIGYEFGAASNLVMGGDKGDEANYGIAGNSQNPTGGFQDMVQSQLAGVQAAMAGVQGQMQGQGQAQGQDAQGAAGEQAALAGATMATAGRTLASASHNWSQGAATGGHTNGNGINNEFAVQDSGKNAPRNASSLSVGNVDLTTGEDDPALALNGKFSNFGRDRDGAVGKGRRTGKGAEELERMRKQSADIANNKYRSANEPASVFLAGQRLSGGLKVDSGSMPTTGEGVNSGTFTDPYKGVNSGDMKNEIKGISDEVATEQEAYLKDIQDLQTMFWIMLATSIVAMIAIPIVNKIPVYGHIAALIIAILAMIPMIIMGVKIFNFVKTWQDNANVDYSSKWAWIGGVGAVLLTAGVWLSFGFASAIYDKIFKPIGELASKFTKWVTNLFPKTPPPTPPAPPTQFV